jgi:ribonuclease HI
MARAKRRNCNVGSGPRFPLAEVLRTIDLKRLDSLETIDPRPLAAWDPPAFEKINIDSDRDKAAEKAAALTETPSIVIYSNASADQNCLGAAAVILDRGQMMIEYRKGSIGSKTQWSIHAAKLIGINYAIGIISNNIFKSRGTSTPHHKTVIIMSDNKSALQAIANPASRSGQQIVYSILKAARHLKTQGVALRLQWVPGHCDNPGNNTADRLAKEAVSPDRMYLFQNLVSREKAFYRDKIRAE